MSGRDVLLSTVIALTASGLAGGCSERPARQPDLIQEPPEHAAMDRLLRDFIHHPSASVSIQQGTEHFDDGVITLVVRGDGTATVEQLRAGTKQRFTKSLAADRIAAVGTALAEHHVTRARTSKLPRSPGDTPLVLRVDGDSGAAFRADLWYGDRYTDRDLDAILRLADVLVHEITGGALGQPVPDARTTP